MNVAKIAKSEMQNNSKLSIAHIASSTPFYCVEEAEIGNSTVSVAYYNENDPDSEIEYANISVKELIDFTNEFYRDYVDFEVAGVHVQERITKAGIDYLKENLNSVITDYLNAKGANNA